MSKYKSKSERVDIVLNIVRQLKNYPNPNKNIEEPIDLYKEEYSYVKKFKQIFSDYIKQDDENPDSLREYKGTIFLEETVRRDVEYILPIHKKREPLFVIRMKSRN